jgi:hypothetical protein
MWMMLPPPALIIAGRIARLIRNAPPTLTPNTLFQSSSVSSSTDPFGSFPAAPFSKMWTVGYLAKIVLAAASTWASLLTSQATAIAVFPIAAAVASAAALSRSTQATFARLRQSERNRAADAVTGAGDDGGFARERIFAGERHDTAAAAMRPDRPPARAD